MTYSSSTLDLDPRKPLHTALLKRINDRFRFSAQRMQRLHRQWRKAEEQFIAYAPERDVDAMRRMKREQGGQPQYTTVILPYTYAMLMSAHSYWTTVFLSRSPVFQFSGRHGESQQKTQAVEALIDYQMQVGEMLVPLYFWLLDMGKYGIGILANYWTEENTTISKITEVPIVDPVFQMPTGRTKKQMDSQQVRGYAGNKVVNIRPYDYYPDPRVPLWSVQRGEFVGYLSELSLNELLRGEAEGRYTNIKALRSIRGGDSFATGREQGSAQVELPNDQNFQLNFSDTLRESGSYGIVTMYVDLVPSDWEVGTSDYPEKWVFTAATSGGTVSQGQMASLRMIVGAMPTGSAHNKFPIHIQEMEPEAYAFASRGMPQVMEPMQNTIDWLLNSHMYNVRKTLNNQIVVDPSRVTMKDVTDPKAGGVWRLKPAAYGTDPKLSFAQVAMQDVTAGNMRDIQFFHEFTQRAVGVNDQIMGMVDTGGRKTAQEVRSSSTFGVNRQKTIAELCSAMGWNSLASQLVQESQQNMDVELKLKIVGDLVMEAGQKFLDVTPEDIQGFYDFVPVDGTMPIDRYAQANLWKEIIQGISSIPQITAQYDLGRIFAWSAQLAGLKNISQFKVQILPQGVQPGSNVVPIGQALGGRQELGNTIEPGQIPNMGTSG